MFRVVGFLGIGNTDLRLVLPAEPDRHDGEHRGGAERGSRRNLAALIRVLVEIDRRTFPDGYDFPEI